MQEASRQEVHRLLGEVFYYLANARSYAEEHRWPSMEHDLTQLITEVLRVRQSIYKQRFDGRIKGDLRTAEPPARRLDS